MALQPPRVNLPERVYTELYNRYLLVGCLARGVSGHNKFGLDLSDIFGLASRDGVLVVKSSGEKVDYGGSGDFGTNFGGHDHVVGSQEEEVSVRDDVDNGRCVGRDGVCHSVAVGKEGVAEKFVSGDSTASSGGSFSAAFSNVVGDSAKDFCPTRENVSFATKGKNYKRNSRKRANRKSERLVGRVGYFSSCSDDVQSQLKETRARMLIAQNELKTRQSVAAVKEVQMLSDTRVNEVDFELRRLTLEEKLSKISEKRGIVQGTAKTVMSSTISSSPPTLLSGSVSPSSSISMAEERKLRQSVVDQASRLKDLEEELLRLKAGVPKTFKSGVHNVSKWTFKSPYDNFTVDGVHKSKLPGYVRNSEDDSCVDGGQDFHLSSHDY